MIDAAGIRELFRYNAWANGLFFRVLSTLGPEQFARDLGSSHASVRDTAVHIIWAEWIWLQR